MGGTVPGRQAYSSVYAPVVSSYPVVSYPAYAPAHTSAYGQVKYSYPSGYLASRGSGYGDLGEREGYSSYPVVSHYPAYAPAPTSAYGQVTYSHPTGYLASRAPA